MGHEDDLIATRTSAEGLRELTGADTLEFLSLSGMMRAVRRDSGYCTACYTGDYPVEVGSPRRKDSFERVLG
jgi:amidophosphoribosyltransferase